MSKNKNAVWEFLSSVKLALIVFFVLAAASIIGTIIPQKETAQRYVELYGPKVANLFHVLSFDNMYASWWFTSLLVLFAVNLTVCTIERFPHIWEEITKDNLAKGADQVRKMSQRRDFVAGTDHEKTVAAVESLLGAAGWPSQKASLGNGATLFFSQKGAWTRLGVILVHVSILIIFVGSLIGTFFGFKSSVMIPEGGETDKVYLSNRDHTPQPLDFKVRCNSFTLTKYDTGMPKEFRSELTITGKDGAKILDKAIVVNDPLQYGGLTFYQSSYQAIEGEFVAHIRNETTGAAQRFNLFARTQTQWPTEKVSFGIVDFQGPDMMQRFRYKIWFNDGKAAPSQFWMTEGTEMRVQRPDTTYVFTAKPRFATGLQVVKDPGVWTVYIGCGIMILGLIVIFFMAHRRIWVLVEPSGEAKTSIILAGLSNKNKIGFENTLNALAERFTDEAALNLPKEPA